MRFHPVRDSAPSPRRAFLRNGLALGAAGLAGSVQAAAPLVAPLATRFPDSMKTLGQADQGYGQPSPHEQSVQRGNCVVQAKRRATIGCL